MIVSSISSRFQKLPGLQRDREGEYARQTSEAERLLQRLRDTRKEAERAAREEIEGTRQVQFETLQEQPEFRQWQRDLQETEQGMRTWGREAEKRSQGLREAITGLERRIQRKQGDLDRVQSQLLQHEGQQARLQEEIRGLEARLYGLQDQLKRAGIEEDDLSNKLNPAYADHDRVQREIDQVKSQRETLGRQWEAMKDRERLCMGVRDGLLLELGDLEGERNAWQVRLARIQEQVQAAEGLCAEAQWLCSDQRGKFAKASQDREFLSRQLQDLETQRTTALQLYGEANEAQRGFQDSIRGIQEGAQGTRRRWEEINGEIERLEQERSILGQQLGDAEARIAGEQQQLFRLMPTLQEADRQVRECTEIFDRSKGALAECLARFEELGRIVREAEAKEEEAKAEVGKARDLERKSVAQMQEGEARIREVQGSLRRAEEDWAQARKKVETNPTPQFLEERLRRALQEAEELGIIYKRALEAHRMAGERRAQLEKQVGGLESELRVKRADLEKFQASGPVSMAQGLRGEIDVLSRQLGDAKAQLQECGGTNPYMQRLQELQSRTQSIREEIFASWNTISSAPPRLLEQLKREAEVVMRAEAAMALERQQETVLRDASRLSRYHLASRPKFDLDEQATSTLLREHVHGADAKGIATAVLDMCDQKHIHA